MRDGRAQATGLVSFKVALAWVMLIGSLGATPPCMWAWYAGKISEKQVVGLTLLLAPCRSAR
jgi:hypothetical protein